MDSEPLMTPESTGEARAALAAFPGIADVTVIELDASQAGQCLIAYVVPSGVGHALPGVLCELFAEVLGVARRGLGSDFFDLAGLFKAPTAGDMDRQLDQMADARK
jgi:hypothetical protein